MDNFTENHLQQWLDYATDEDNRQQVEADIKAAVKADADILTFMSWEQIRDSITS